LANPRVFISSTYYDLKHIRSSMDIFIESMGYESILSEKGNIAYSPDMPLDESCYKEVSSADIFVLIIGGRYGSEASDGEREKSKEFFDRYESVTKKEFEEANKRDIPTYVLIENSVYSEYQTYLRNKKNENISYAHVDSVNIFKFIETILSRPRNNPMKTFEKFSDINSWLREQWAGLFRELLKRMSDQKKFTELSHQVDGLKEINTTLKTYLEAVMKVVSPDESNIVIQAEDKRLTEINRIDQVRENPLGEHLIEFLKLPINDLITEIINAKSSIGFARGVSKLAKDDSKGQRLIELFESNPSVTNDFNDLRTILGLSLLPQPAKKSSNKKINKVT
jgi:hypothetical protein